MQKIIPLIYFYVLSAVGMTLFIIGIFSSIQYMVNVTQFSSYPLQGQEYICQTPKPVTPPEPVVTPSSQETAQCISDEKKKAKINDLEKSLSFTIIGFLVFAGHFYFARKSSKA